MKIWLSKNSEVSVRKQLVSQITLGIASRDLKTGEKLPSIRELARRFHIHQNTVSAAYRELAEDGLVEFRKGSGVYVGALKALETTRPSLDQVIENFLEEAAAQGFERRKIYANLQNRLMAKPPTRFLVVESDLELLAILKEEVYEATGCEVDGISFEEFSADDKAADTQIVAIFDEKEKLEKILPPESQCIFLRANSVPDSMAGKTRPLSSELIAVVSGWEKFLTFAKLYLVAAKIEPETLVLRSLDEPNWKKGLNRVSLIICDSVTAKKFPKDDRVNIFKLISGSSLEDLRRITT